MKMGKQSKKVKQPKLVEESTPAKRSNPKPNGGEAGEVEQLKAIETVETGAAGA